MEIRTRSKRNVPGLYLNRKRDIRVTISSFRFIKAFCSKFHVSFFNDPFGINFVVYKHFELINILKESGTTV
jgi:hypothetical protein